MNEYCQFILTQDHAHRKLAVSYGDIETRSQLIENAAAIMDTINGIYGKDFDAKKFLWGTISRFSTKKELYGNFKADDKIERLYQSTLAKIETEKNTDLSYLSCYEIILNLCLIYSNMVECHVEQENCIREVWTEVNIVAVYNWIATLEARARKLYEKHSKKVEKMQEVEMTDSLFKMLQKTITALPILQVTKDMYSYFYMIDILCATVTHSEEIRNDKSHSRKFFALPKKLKRML